MSRGTVAWICIAAHVALWTPAARADDEPAPPVEALQVDSPRPEGPNWLGLGLAGAGLLGGIGLAVVLKNEADDRYDAYRLLADPELSRDKRDEAQRYDRLSLIGWAVAQASFVALVLLLMEDRGSPTIPPQGEPLLESSADGVHVGWRVAP